ncbi:uncharacterized protein LOC131025153 [Salvia miltiorrhiza]|uniref:uncharacterized protein LOC131025153 n=1 Tax=Salvia miltiorrhiza TaxID=226208 RepID=UPI0025AB67D6|nr:uncharacterized protein LOC131025153 [Salvia miltiorrhiza]
MDEDQELRFVCKLCFKKYPCGKSLGGHMRSHVVANSAESDEKLLDPNIKKFPSFVLVNGGGGGGGGGGMQGTMSDSRIVDLGNGQSSYGLRENPRKSWRAVDSSFPMPQEKICKQCGKGFHSLKALCGHMACHSEKDRGMKDDHSWTSESHKLVTDSHSDTEGEDRAIRTRSSKSKKFRKIVVNSPFPNGSSSVSEIDGEEQEEVALCLMMLSRDNGSKGGVNSVVESSDNNSVILETKSSSIDMKNVMRKCDVVKNADDDDQDGKKGVAKAANSDSGYFLDECAKAESDVSVDGFRRGSGVNEYEEFRESLNRSRSYRAEVKKALAKENAYDYDHDHGGSSVAARIEQSRKRRYVSESCDVYNEYDRIKRSDPPSAEKRLKYECFNCKKTFKSYQALGGHRPCHKKSSNALYESRYESGENSLDDEFGASRGKMAESTRKAAVAAAAADKKMKAKKSKGHVCPFCNRVFKNGQALGGHKRSHFIGGHEVVNTNPSPVTKLDLLDLNLPAPQDDEDDGDDQYSPW